MFLLQFGGDIDHLAERGVVAVDRRQSVFSQQVGGARAGGSPAVVGQIGPRVRAVAEIHQARHVEVEAMAPEPLRQAPHASPQFFFVEPIDVAQDFGGELAARYALGGDLVKQPVLRLGGQIAQQPLGDPGGPLRVVQSRLFAGRWASRRANRPPRCAGRSWVPHPGRPASWS